MTGFVIAYVIIVISGFICFFFTNKSKSDKQKNNDSAEKIVREDLLVYSLKNPYTLDRNVPPPSSRRLMLSVAAGSGKNRQKLVFDPAHTVSFGRNDKNQIMICDRTVSDFHGCIFLSNKKIWVRNTSSNQYLTVRRSLFKKYNLGPKATLQLFSGDQILVNGNKLKLKIFVFDINHK